MSIGNVLLEKSIKVFSKPSGLKCDPGIRLILSRIYSLFQQRTYTKNNTYLEKVLTLRKPVQILKKIQNTNPR